MKILAVEFSSAHRSVAVAEAGDCQHVTVLGTARETAAPKTRALTLVASALAQAGVEREAIDCLAVGLGPGSYTGIRAAISLAQGWQLARQIRLVGISSVECLAAQACAAGAHGAVTLIIDAQREEFYLARYDLGAAAAVLHEPEPGTPHRSLTVAAGSATAPSRDREGAVAPREAEPFNKEQRALLEPLHLVPAAEVERRLAAGERVVGPEASRWFAAAQDLFPEAAMLARLAGQSTGQVPGEQLEPIYLRETAFVKAPARR